MPTPLLPMLPTPSLPAASAGTTDGTRSRYECADSPSRFSLHAFADATTGVGPLAPMYRHGREQFFQELLREMTYVPPRARPPLPPRAD